MDFKRLTKDNFMLYAMGNYTNPDCIGMNEFNEDLCKIKYVKRLLKRYARTGNLRTILLLNHLVVLGNVFGRTPAARMLFFKLEQETYPALKTVLLYLEYIHEGTAFDGIKIDDIPFDGKLGQILRNLR
jgi:hypothetical protein